MWGIPLKPVGTLLLSYVRVTQSSQIILGGFVVIIIVPYVICSDVCTKSF